jgi:hypothetical protein
VLHFTNSNHFPNTYRLPNVEDRYLPAPSPVTMRRLDLLGLISDLGRGVPYLLSTPFLSAPSHVSLLTHHDHLGDPRQSLTCRFPWLLRLPAIIITKHGDQIFASIVVILHSSSAFHCNVHNNKKRTIILARAAIFPSSEEHCSRILPAHPEVELSASIDFMHYQLILTPNKTV